MKLSPDKKLDVREILKGLEKYQPRRKGWTWRKKVKDNKIGPFVYKMFLRNFDISPLFRFP